MRGIALQVSKIITGEEYERMAKRAKKQFDRLKLDNVRYKGRPTPSTWQKYEVY
jgi:protein-L-isoaspartate O-methyltransferase